MSVTFDVRDMMKSIIESDLIPPDSPAGALTVYVSPEDDEAGIAVTAFPTIIIQKGLYSTVDSWKKKTQVDSEYTWWLEIICYLAEAVYPDWQAQKLVEDWL